MLDQTIVCVRQLTPAFEIQHMEQHFKPHRAVLLQLHAQDTVRLLRPNAAPVHPVSEIANPTMKVWKQQAAAQVHPASEIANQIHQHVRHNVLIVKGALRIVAALSVR